MSINIEKIKSLLSKGTVAEQIAAFPEIKSHITNNIQEEQKKKADEASDLQSKLDSINGN